MNKTEQLIQYMKDKIVKLDGAESPLDFSKGIYAGKKLAYQDIIDQLVVETTNE